MSNYIETAEKTELPLLPLRGAVAFPSVQINLEILRPSSLRAFGAAATSGALIFLVAQKDPAVEEPTPSDFYKMGTICQIRHVTKNPDGHLSVTFEGICRAGISSIIFTKGHFRAQVIKRGIQLGTISVSKSKKLTDELFEQLEVLKNTHPLINDEMILAARALKNTGALADFVASGALLHYTNKQTILECINPVSRLDRLCTLLSEETDIFHCELDIRRRVHERIDEHQRDYFLREQLKVIQQELGEDEDEIEEYQEKIEKLHCSDDIRKKLKKELGRLEKAPFGAAESTVLRNYLDTCLDLPFGQLSKEQFNVKEAKKILEREHDGLEKVKDRILEFIAVKQLSPQIKNQILCLVGPPGVGKTSIAASISHALKRKYARISLGGIRDEADIRGHRKTYVGAMPGRIIDAIVEAGSMNPVIVLDEIDKLSHSMQGDPASALLEVLDPEQNKHFRDHFLEFPLDLSDCLFIATANDYEGIPYPLLDRMEIIELSAYTRGEKMNIARNHLIPKQLQRHGVNRRQVKITDEGLCEVIDFYTKEAGVRSLERTIAALCRKSARRIAEGGAKTVLINAKTVHELLGKRKFFEENLEDTDPIGVVNGLAYTAAGGDLLKVEVSVLEGTGTIETTGSLGDVMKESAKIAVSFIRSVYDKLDLPKDFYKTKDIHIHFPEGAVPKDGPSAGITMVCALASALTSRPVRRDVAMTGEISLRGKILPIGGLKEKTFAAYRAHVNTVLIPRENERDLEDISAEARDSLNFVLCDTAWDALSYVLLPPSNIQDAEENLLSIPAYSLPTSSLTPPASTYFHNK